MNTISCFALAIALASTAAMSTQSPATESAPRQESMPLGNFSLSLAVKDLEASKAFYEKLDFVQVGGVMKQNWLILQNGTTTIGLFQGMFEENIMTFNPGWDTNKSTLKDFIDVRQIQSSIMERGIKPIMQADPNTHGPANFMLEDPDGNTILFDQHVDAPQPATLDEK